MEKLSALPRRRKRGRAQAPNRAGAYHADAQGRPQKGQGEMRFTVKRIFPCREVFDSYCNIVTLEISLM